MADRYTIYPASFGALSTLNLQQIEGVGVKPDAKKDTIIPGGNLDPSAVILLGAEPVVNLKTGDISTVLTAVSPTNGLNCATANTIIQFQKRQSGAGLATGGVHVVITNKLGFLVPKRLTVSQEKPAELELDYHCLWDGTKSGSPALPVPPLSIAVNQALTSTPAFNSRFYQGPIYANAVQMPGVKQWELDFGIEVERMPTDGDLWSQVISIKSRKPKMTAKFTDAAAANTAAGYFNAALPGVLAFYLREGASGAARTSDAMGAHVKVSAATGAWSCNDQSVEGADDADTSIEAEVTGTIAVATNSTIP